MRGVKPPRSSAAMSGGVTCVIRIEWCSFAQFGWYRGESRPI